MSENDSDYVPPSDEESEDSGMRYALVFVDNRAYIPEITCMRVDVSMEDALEELQYILEKEETDKFEYYDLGVYVNEKLQSYHILECDNWDE